MSSVDPPEQSSPTETVRAAFEAFARSDRQAVQQLIGDNFVWVFFDPLDDSPVLRSCSGRSEITRRMKNWPAAAGWELVEIEPFGSRVAVTTISPAEPLRPSWRRSDENFHVVEVRDGRIVALRACRDRGEALRLASTATESLSI